MAFDISKPAEASYAVVSISLIACRISWNNSSCYFGSDDEFDGYWFEYQCSDYYKRYVSEAFPIFQMEAQKRIGIAPFMEDP